MGFPAPLGVRAHHMRMIGLMSSLALTFALFVSDVAYTNEKIKGDAKIGALLTVIQRERERQTTPSPSCMAYPQH